MVNDTELSSTSVTYTVTAEAMKLSSFNVICKNRNIYNYSTSDSNGIYTITAKDENAKTLTMTVDGTSYKKSIAGHQAESVTLVIRYSFYNETTGTTTTSDETYTYGVPSNVGESVNIDYSTSAASGYQVISTTFNEPSDYDTETVEFETPLEKAMGDTFTISASCESNLYVMGGIADKYSNPVSGVQDRSESYIDGTAVIGSGDSSFVFSDNAVATAYGIWWAEEDYASLYHDTDLTPNTMEWIGVPDFCWKIDLSKNIEFGYAYIYTDETAAAIGSGLFMKTADGIKAMRLFMKTADGIKAMRIVIKKE